MPTPVEEVDVFDISVGGLTLLTPWGPEVINVTGPTTVVVSFEGAQEGDANDDDGDGLDDVATRMTELNLTGFNPALGPVVVRLDPSRETVGTIEETTNNTPGTLDVAPFTAAGTAMSDFNIWFEIEVGGELYYPVRPKRMTSLITHKPPGPGDVYFGRDEIPLVDAAGNQTPFVLSGTWHEPNPPIEVDEFPFSLGNMELVTPQGIETLDVTGSATAHVYFEGPTEGTANDDDGDGREEVLTRMVDLDLAGYSPSLGPVYVRLNPAMPSLGLIEETTNATAGILDLPPFTPTGTADSYFDLFFEIEVGGQFYYTAAPKHMSGRITHKPPGPLDWYENLEQIELLDANGVPTGMFLGATRHAPDPVVEIDVFEDSIGRFDLVTPLGVETIAMSGPTTAYVFFEGTTEGSADDDDLNGLDEVVSQLVDMELSGMSPTLGPVIVRLNPNIPSHGRIEETANATPGVLDVRPFTDSGTADSFFDVFFEVELPAISERFYTIQPKRMSSRITYKPPGPGDFYENLEPIELYDAAGNPTGYFIGANRHVPNPVRPEVVGRHIFYNDSVWDGNNPLPNANDDNAIAPSPATASDPWLGKEALLPGQRADFQNYTSYVKGINGIMVDIRGSSGVPTTDNFVFRMGNSFDVGSWPLAPPPRSITVRPGAGVDGSDRVTLIWPDNAIHKQWLQVTVRLAGMEQPDVFYWGNAIAESGNSATDAKVNAIDMLSARDNPHNFLRPAPIDDFVDFNRDRRVNATDMLIARDNNTNFFTALKLIRAPGIGAAGEKVGEVAAVAAREVVFADDVGSRGGESSPSRLDWLHEYEQIARNDKLEETDAVGQALRGLMMDDMP